MYNLARIIFVEGYATCLWAGYEFKLNWDVSASKTKQSIRIWEFKTEAPFNIYAWKPSNKPATKFYNTVQDFSVYKYSTIFLWKHVIFFHFSTNSQAHQLSDQPISACNTHWNKFFLYKCYYYFQWTCTVDTEWNTKIIHSPLSSSTASSRETHTHTNTTTSVQTDPMVSWLNMLLSIFLSIFLSLQMSLFFFLHLFFKNIFCLFV